MSQSKNSQVRFAIVGAGHMGLKHLQKINQIGDRIGARVSVVVEPDEARAALLAKEYQEFDIRFVTHVGQIPALGADYFPEAAIIAVPASIHVETARACLEKGWHVLVEKPMGFSAIDCKEIGDAAHKAKRLVQVGLLERWSMAHIWGDWRPKIGPVTIQAVRSGPFVPRAADTDVIHDLMVHDLDLFVLLDEVFGLSPVVAVRAWGRKLRSKHIDYAKVALDLENGGTAHFFASRLAADPSRRWELTGPSWHASIDMMRRHFTSFEKKEQKGKTWFEPSERTWDGGDPLGLEIEAFVQRIRGTFDSIAGISAKDPIFSFWDPKKIIPTSESVHKTHVIIDEILSNIRVLES
jgi:predicted dehydrogenase